MAIWLAPSQTAHCSSGPTLLTDRRELASISNGDLIVLSANESYIIDQSSLKLKAQLIHENTFMLSFAELDNGYLATGSSNGTIMIWNKMSDYSYVRTLAGHSFSIWSMTRLANGDLASADNEIRVWDRRDFSLKFKINYYDNGHSNMINKFLYLSNGLLATTSWDSTVRLWEIGGENSGDFKLKKVLTGHRTLILDLIQMKKNGDLVSSDIDGAVIVWSGANDFELKQKIEHRKRVNQVMDLGDFLVTASYDKQIKLWQTNINSYPQNRSIEIEDPFSSMLLLKKSNKYLASGTDN